MKPETLKTIDNMFDKRYNEVAALISKSDEQFIRDAAGVELNKLASQWNEFRKEHNIK